MTKKGILMQYLVIVYDYEDALEKRFEVREAHIEGAKKLIKEGIQYANQFLEACNESEPLSEHSLSEHSLSEHSLSEHSLSEHSLSEHSLSKQLSYSNDPKCNL